MTKEAVMKAVMKRLMKKGQIQTMARRLAYFFSRQFYLPSIQPDEVTKLA